MQTVFNSVQSFFNVSTLRYYGQFVPFSSVHAHVFFYVSTVSLLCLSVQSMSFLRFNITLLQCSLCLMHVVQFMFYVSKLRSLALSVQLSFLYVSTLRYYGQFVPFSSASHVLRLKITLPRSVCAFSSFHVFCTSKQYVTTVSLCLLVQFMSYVSKLRYYGHLRLISSVHVFFLFFLYVSTSYGQFVPQFSSVHVLRKNYVTTVNLHLQFILCVFYVSTVRYYGQFVPFSSVHVLRLKITLLRSLSLHQFMSYILTLRYYCQFVPFSWVYVFYAYYVTTVWLCAFRSFHLFLTSQHYVTTVSLCLQVQFSSCRRLRWEAEGSCIFYNLNITLSRSVCAYFQFSSCLFFMSQHYVAFSYGSCLYVRLNKFVPYDM